ncbi:MAG: diacylglycerol kinase family lipid kinase [Clostridiales bacterium]|nr:diacylglycerol kinase family lipid kinase [Clostridiales bacterium]
MFQHKLLIIVNLTAGQKRIARKLPDVLQLFCKNGYLPTVMTTLYQGHARELARTYAHEFDLVVCAGGDGTLSETIAGLMDAHLDLPLGYIPCGTTNDLASTLGLSSDIDQAALDILGGKATELDVGIFNGKTFAYTASFGAFTRASYATPQTLKNTLGHLAYLLEGLKDLTNIRPIAAHIKTDESEFDGKYVFGSISNSTSLGGVLTLDKEQVMLDDGKFELVLMESPENAYELSQLLLNLTQRKFEPPILLINSSSIEITTAQPMDWTLDGEYVKGDTEFAIKNLHAAAKIIVPDSIGNDVEEDEEG